MEGQNHYIFHIYGKHKLLIFLRGKYCPSLHNIYITIISRGDRQEKALDQKSGLEIRTDAAVFIYMAHCRIVCLGNFLKNTPLEKPSGFFLRIQCSRVQKYAPFRVLRDQEYVTFNDTNDTSSCWIKGSQGHCVLIHSETWMEINMQRYLNKDNVY